MLVNADGHVHRFSAKLVAHGDAVFSRVGHGDVVDGDGAAPGLLGDVELGVFSDLLVVPKPGDLRGGFAVDEARQTQRLEGRTRSSEENRK